MSAPDVHLICQAHLDPVWLWNRDEGLAEALSTFRTAAELAEHTPAFVFCHNEAVLYDHIADRDPALLRRIRALVRRGRWHVMGGWWLQPDCNLPSGEAQVRQIALGRRWFARVLGVRPTVAFNIDSFGHSRGLVQLLVRCGYAGYLHCRPTPAQMPGPDTVEWEGYDGSRLVAHRVVSWYQSQPGEARRKVEDILAKLPAAAPPELILWGVGDHGGGPSRRDLGDLERLRRERAPAQRILHSTPERWLAAMRAARPDLPVHRRDLGPCFTGCYTSQARVKHAFRALEDELLLTEKLCAAAWIQCGRAWPAEDLAAAERDLAFLAFHDILPGTSVPSAEAASLRLAGHARERLARARETAQHALLAGQRPLRDGEAAAFAWNPHPWPVTAELEVEAFVPGAPGPFAIRVGGRAVPSQQEQAQHCFDAPWRPRIVARVTLPPASTTRLDIVRAPQAAGGARVQTGRTAIRVAAGGQTLTISRRTGLLAGWRVGGREQLAGPAVLPLLLADTESAWGRTTAYRDIVGRFRLASPAVAARHAGVRAPRLAPVRVIEHGPVRTVVEAILVGGDSRVVLRYRIPATGDGFTVEALVSWRERDRLLKLAVPTRLRGATLRAQSVFGHDARPDDGSESVHQRWLALVDGRRAITVVADRSSACDLRRGELRLSLLRAPAPAGTPPKAGHGGVPQDRYVERCDQGEHAFRFRFAAGAAAKRLAAIERESTALVQAPPVLACNPHVPGRRSGPFIRLDDPVVQLSAVTRAPDGRRLLVRLHEPSGRARRTVLRIPALGVRLPVDLGPFALRTFAIDPRSGRIAETDPTGEARR